MIYVCLTGVFLWDCVIKDKNDKIINDECSDPEDWFGSVYGIAYLLGFSIYVRIAAVIVFGIAVCRISNLLGKLQ